MAKGKKTKRPFGFPKIEGSQKGLRSLNINSSKGIAVWDLV